MTHAPAPQTPARQDPAAAPGDALHGLTSSPEFLIRRAHQIASAAFTQACADLDLTPSQYAALFALRQHARVGQNELGRLIALDRSTTSTVVKTLRERGLVHVSADAHDRRKTLLEVSDSGRLLLSKAEQRSARANAALMSSFDRQQAADFLALLHKLSQSLDGGGDGP